MLLTQFLKSIDLLDPAVHDLPAPLLPGQLQLGHLPVEVLELLPEVVLLSLVTLLALLPARALRYEATVQALSLKICNSYQTW